MLHHRPRIRESFLPFSPPCLGPEEIAEVVDTLKSGWLALGPKTKRFEQEFAAYVGARHAVAVNSGTAGMELSLIALSIGPGDEVITSPLTFCATANVVIHLGATPVLADVCTDDLNIDPAEVEKALTPRTKALIPVHFGGQPCRMDELMALAAEHRLWVIEDAAHAVGAQYKGRKIGTIGHATAFSFYATKNLTTGEGGMVTTDDAALGEKVAMLSQHGISRDAWKRYGAEGSWYYEVLYPGYNYKMMDLQASLGLHQLAKLEGFLARRAQIAATYTRAFADCSEIITPSARPEVRHAWHLYPIRLKRAALRIGRHEFIEELRRRNIGTSVHFIPLHLHPYYQEKYGFRPGDFPQAEAAYEGIISLPQHPGLTDEDVADVVEAVREMVRENRR